MKPGAGWCVSWCGPFFLFRDQARLRFVKEMQRRNRQMAIVVDEHGSVPGDVTVEDLVEEIVVKSGRMIV